MSAISDKQEKILENLSRFTVFEKSRLKYLFQINKCWIYHSIKDVFKAISNKKTTQQKTETTPWTHWHNNGFKILP